MAVVPETAAVGTRYFQPVAQRLAAAGDPENQAADKNQHQRQRRDPDDGFSDRLFTFRRRRVEQPAVKFPHRTEECRAFGPAVHIAGIGVYAQLFASRLAESGHAGFVAAGGELQRNQVQRIGHLRADAVGELRRPKRTCVGGCCDPIKLRMQRPGNFALEDEHGARQTDDGQDDTERQREPQMYFCEYLFHDSGVLPGQGSGPRDDGPPSCRSGSYFRTVSLPAVATDSASMTSPLVACPVAASIL